MNVPYSYPKTKDDFLSHKDSGSGLDTFIVAIGLSYYRERELAHTFKKDHQLNKSTHLLLSL